MSAAAPESLSVPMTPERAADVIAKTIVGMETHLPDMVKEDEIFTVNSAAGMVDVARDKKNARRFGSDLYPLASGLTRRAAAYEKEHGLEPGTLVGPEVQEAMGVLAVQAGWVGEAPRLGKQISVGWDGKTGTIATWVAPATPEAITPAATPEQTPTKAAKVPRHLSLVPELPANGSAQA